MKTITFSALPALGVDLDEGTFAGCVTLPGGRLVAVVLLPGPGCAERVRWQQAMDWAASRMGELPTRPVAALLFANVTEKLDPYWHWTSEQWDATIAWGCDFGDGLQGTSHKSYEGRAVAVRYIDITQE